MISVITRTKDREIFLDRVFESLINQTYRPIEWIIVNDNGKDISEKIANYKNFKSKDFYIKYIYKNTSTTMEAATNIGLKSATGKYINILDDDDTIEKTYYEKALSHLSLYENIRNIKGVVCYTNLIFEKIKNENIILEKKEPFPLQPKEILLSDILRENQFPIHSFIYQKNILEKIGLYNEDFVVLGDWEFNIRYFEYFDVVVLEEYLVNYHKRSEGKYLNTDKTIMKKYNFYRGLLRNNILRKFPNSFITELRDQKKLEKELNDKEQHIVNLVNIQSNLEKIIINKDKDIVNLQKIKENLEESIKDKDKDIINLQKIREDLERDIKQKDKDIYDLKKISFEQENKIKYIKDDIKNKKIHIRNIEANLNNKDIHIRNIESELAFYQDLAQFLRLKNRFKRLILKPIPTNVKKFIKTIVEDGYKEAFFKVKYKVYLSKNYTYTEVINSKSIAMELKNFTYLPKISVIMPVYNIDPKWLEKAIVSIKKQFYKNWELCIVDDCSTNKETINYLKMVKNKKIKVKFLDRNQGISVASNKALSMTSGEFIALMDNDDELSLDAFYQVIKVINERDAEFIYSDEDKVNLEGKYSMPHFKPDFAFDHFLSQNYISHLGVIKKSLIDNVGGFAKGLEGAQDFDLYLKVIEQTDKIEHISKVLYHWRMIPGSTAENFGEKSYAWEAGRKALENFINRNNIKAKALKGKHPGTYRVKYDIKDKPLISIIIPFKDKPELLKMCIESILEKSTYFNFEIIGMSNNSEEEKTFHEMQRLEQLDSRISFYEYNVPFNFSKINNYAVKNYAKGKHIILLNNDIEIISKDWIETLLEHSQRDDIGVVGAKLYYPNDTIQHAGVVLGIGGVAGHSHKYFSKNQAGYFSRLDIVQNYSALTAACFMVKKSIYQEVDGLNEKDLTIAFNDIDFCLKVMEKGYRNLFTPYCEAYHHESISRGAEDNPQKVHRFNKEVEYMKKRYGNLLENDPFYNKNLSLIREDFSLK